MRECRFCWRVCAGLDVHKKVVVACGRILDAQRAMHTTVRRFGTMTSDWLELRAWLAEAKVTHVAMESTGVFWYPVFNLLEGHFEVWLVNAQHIKKVPGRNTDVKEAEWIAQLLQFPEAETLLSELERSPPPVATVSTLGSV